MHRYSNIEFLMAMDFKDFIGMFIKAKTQDYEEKLWELWLVQYPLMDATNFISFEDFKAKSLNPKTKKTNNDDENKKFNIKEILEEAERIKNLDKRGGN